MDHPFTVSKAANITIKVLRLCRMVQAISIKNRCNLPLIAKTVLPVKFFAALRYLFYIRTISQYQVLKTQTGGSLTIPWH